MPVFTERVKQVRSYKKKEKIYYMRGEDDENDKSSQLQGEG